MFAKLTRLTGPDAVALFDRLARPTRTPRLVSEIAAKFLLSNDFVHAYLDEQQVLQAGRDSSYDAFWAGLNSLQQMYIGFALTTTTRGIEIRSLLTPHLPTRAGPRYLDVGCGYGGFLRAFAQAGFESVGVEVRPNLAALSRANVADIPGARVIEGDFLAQSQATLGTFDCITCNDVIEHVQDPVAAMHNMASLVRPGGVLFMEIPNRDFIGFVAKDGHYQLFGITTLSREEAGRYYDILVRPATQIAYHDNMGDYLPREFYEHTLREQDIECSLLERHVGGLPGTLHQLNDVKPRLPALLGREIETAYARYCARLYADVASMHETANVAAFRRRYLLSFWSLLGRRSE
jgi:SAM-dependent methyltransferase